MRIVLRTSQTRPLWNDRCRGLRPLPSMVNTDLHEAIDARLAEGGDALMSLHGIVQEGRSKK